MALVLEQPRDYQLTPGESRQRLGNCQEGLEPHLVGRDKEDRTDAFQPVCRARIGQFCSERWFLGEDCKLEPLKRRRRLEPEFIHQHGTRPSVDLQRGRLSSGSVEREHELASKPLMQWMVCHELLQFGDKLRVTAQKKVGLDPVFERDEPKLFESCDRGLRERVVREVGERHTAPECECLPKQIRCITRPPGSKRPTCFIGSALESFDVKLVSGQSDDVARRTRLDHRS